jgi:hypothetical protein
MTRLGSILARALILAMLLLTIGGGIANADTGLADGSGTNMLPDDPGYELSQ